MKNIHIKLKLTSALTTAAILALTGCASVAPKVETNISVFHELLPAPQSGTTISVLPWRKDLEKSLEFRSYATRMESKLQQYGYNIAASGVKPTFVLFVDYGIDDGRTVSIPYSIPQFGVTGYSGATTTGTVSTLGSTSYINANTTKTPTYGVTGYQTGVSNNTVYRRFVNVDVVELGPSGEAVQKRYEGRLKSEGSCGNLPAIMPILIDSLFLEFPGKSGAAGKREMPWSGNC